MVYIICTGDATPDNIVDTMYLAGAEDDEAETIKFGKDDLGKYGYYKHNDDHFIPFIDPNEVNQVYQLLGESSGNWNEITLSKSVNEYDSCYVAVDMSGVWGVSGTYAKFIGKEMYGQGVQFLNDTVNATRRVSVVLNGNKATINSSGLEGNPVSVKVYGVKFEAECEPPVQMKLYTNPLDEIEFGEVNGVYGFRIEGTDDLIPFGKDSNKGDMDYDVLYTADLAPNQNKSIELNSGINNYDAVLINVRFHRYPTDTPGSGDNSKTYLLPRNEYNNGSTHTAIAYDSSHWLHFNTTDYTHGTVATANDSGTGYAIKVYGITYKANCSFATEVKLTTDATKSIKFDEEDDHYGYIDNDGLFHAFGSGGGMPDDTAWREPKASDTGRVGVVRNTVFQQINDLTNADVSWFNEGFPYFTRGIKLKLNGTEHVFYNHGSDSYYEFNPITGFDTSGPFAAKLDVSANAFHPIQIGDETYGIIASNNIRRVYYDETAQLWKTKTATELASASSLNPQKGLAYKGYLFVPGGEHSGSNETYVTDWYRSTTPIDEWDLDDSSFEVSFEKIGEAVPSPYADGYNNRSDQIVMDDQGRVAIFYGSDVSATYKYIVYQLSTNQAPQYVGAFDLNATGDTMFIELTPGTYFYVDKDANMKISYDFTTGEWETLVDENGDPLHLITPKEFTRCTFTLNGTYYFAELTDDWPAVGGLLHSTKPSLYLSWEDYSGGGGGEPMTDEEIEDAFEESVESSTLMEKVLNMIYPIGAIAYGAKPTIGNWQSYTDDVKLYRHNIQVTKGSTGGADEVRIYIDWVDTSSENINTYAKFVASYKSNHGNWVMASGWFVNNNLRCNVGRMNLSTDDRLQITGNACTTGASNQIYISSDGSYSDTVKTIIAPTGKTAWIRVS